MLCAQSALSAETEAKEELQETVMKLEASLNAQRDEHLTQMLQKVWAVAVCCVPVSDEQFFKLCPVKQCGRILYFTNTASISREQVNVRMFARVN